MNRNRLCPYRSNWLTIILIGMISLPLFSSAQTIENTSWKAYYALISDTVSVEIETDTFRVNTSTGFNVLKSWIMISGDTMWIADITGPSTICPTSDTASYTYTIQNDTLDFTPIIDSCAQRLSVLDSTDIWRDPQGPPTQVDETTLDAIVFYPNPISDMVNFEFSQPTRVDIHTIDGQLLRSIQYDRGIHRMKPGLASGTYLCQFKSREVLEQAIWIVQ